MGCTGSTGDDWWILKTVVISVMGCTRHTIVTIVNNKDGYILKDADFYWLVVLITLRVSSRRDINFIEAVKKTEASSLHQTADYFGGFWTLYLENIY